MATSDGNLEAIEKRLDIVIRLLSLLVDTNKVPAIGDQISLLADRGLTPAEIGRIVGREANYVSASLSTRKKVRKNAKR